MPPRKLTERDMRRMMIPERYWQVKLSGVEAMAEAHGVADVPLADVLKGYIAKLEEMVLAGSGLLLFGNNGRGKTAALVWLAMQIRRRGYRVLYVETAKLKSYKIERTRYDATQTIWERMMEVDVLVLDDLGKGVSDSKGFMQELVDELVRTRGAHLRPTLISTNVAPAKLVKDDFLKKSTLAMLQETVGFFHCKGDDIRARARVALVESILEGVDAAD